MRKAALIQGGIMGLRDMSCCFTQDPDVAGLPRL